MARRTSRRKTTDLEIVVDLVQHKRTTVLELTVIALIAFEIILALAEKFLFKK